MVFSVVMYGCKSCTIKNWCFWIVVLEKTLKSPLDCKEIKPINPKGNQPWIFIGRTDAEAKAPILWPPDVKSQLLEKTPMLGKTVGMRIRERQRTRWLDGITESMDMNSSKLQRWWRTGRPGVYGVTKHPWCLCHKADMTEQLNNNDQWQPPPPILLLMLYFNCLFHFQPYLLNTVSCFHWTIHWKDWGWSWNSNTLAPWCKELTHLKRPWYWERLKGRGEGDDRGWDGWMASLTQWTCVWVNSRSWWWTGRSGVLWSMGSQRVGNDWATELNWSSLQAGVSQFHSPFYS